MAIRPYSGETFVAFMDICGFTKTMSDGDKALRALDGFYSTGYRVLREQRLLRRQRVEGFFISDSGILFVRRRPDDVRSESLGRLMGVVREISTAMIARDVMLATSIAYGDFSCDDRLEFHGIEKSAIRGTAYVAAVLDNMKRTPAIQPGQCRIVRAGLPDDVNVAIVDRARGLELVREREDDRDRLYYYWMLRTAADTRTFERDFANATDACYREQLRVLQRASARMPHD